MMAQKLHKKKLKYESMLKKDTDIEGIEASSCPTTVSYLTPYQGHHKDCWTSSTEAREPVEINLQFLKFQ